jgi:predicted dehydrogenase
MANIPTVALVGLGGYGNTYVNALLADDASKRASLIAGVDPAPESCARIADLRQRQIPIFKSLEEFLAAGRADLVVLCTPLHLHCEQAVAALDHGCHVLCEKPLGGHPDQARQMIDARDRAGRQIAIGYQWSFSAPIQMLKRDIAAGRYGLPRRLRTRVYWPRGEKYYHRNSWAGRQRDSSGRWILDSPANNACAHFLHNMFYVLGSSAAESDWPTRVEAELYRANPIENFDTIALRGRTIGGAEILFYASHVTHDQRQPIFHYEFERGSIHFGGDVGDNIVAMAAGAERITYGTPAPANTVQKLFDVLNAITHDRAVTCGPEAAGAQTACIFAAQQSSNIEEFPRDLIGTEASADDRRFFVQGLSEALDRSYEQGVLPSDLGVPWARAPRAVSISR